MLRSVWLGRALFAVAVALLGYCGFVLVEGWSFQRAEDSQLEQLQQPPQAAEGDAVPPAAASATPGAVAGLIGRIEIPRLGLSAIVMEGTGSGTLRHAVGHIRGMALPGQSGNIGIAGHRDTYFRPLRNIHETDLVTLTTALGEYRYRVVSVSVVPPNDVSVLNRGESESLTLVTCYPFYFVGPAPGRFIVRAKRIT